MAGTDAYEDLHEDDDLAFAQLVDQFDSELQERIGQSEEQADTRYFYIDYMNKVLAAAKALELHQFSNWQVPNFSDDVYETQRAFSFAVQNFVMQIRIRKSRTQRLYSVALDQETKDKIHSYIHGIRELIDRADLEVGKKNSLFAKLDAFAADVNRARTQFQNALLAYISISDAFKDTVEGLVPITKLINSINVALGRAKAAEPEATKLPPPIDDKRIDPPKKQIETKKASRALDDEIPF